MPHPLQYRKVLVPLDFSDRSLETLRYAAAFAQQHGSQLILVHAVEPLIYSADLGTFGAPLQTMTADLKKAAAEKLREWSEKVIPAGIPVKKLISVGTAFQQITSAAAREKVDLIILSTHGFTGLKHVLLGSTAERVVRHASTPVLTLRGKISLKPHAARPRRKRAKPTE